MTIIDAHATADGKAVPSDFLDIAIDQYRNGPQYKDGPEYLPDAIQLAIAQQLSRIADVMERDQQDRLNREGYAR